MFASGIPLELPAGVKRDLSQIRGNLRDQALSSGSLETTVSFLRPRRTLRPRANTTHLGREQLREGWPHQSLLRRVIFLIGQLRRHLRWLWLHDAAKFRPARQNLACAPGSIALSQFRQRISRRLVPLFDPGRNFVAQGGIHCLQASQLRIEFGSDHKARELSGKR